jgi:hypothetical protein
MVFTCWNGLIHNKKRILSIYTLLVVLILSSFIPKKSNAWKNASIHYITNETVQSPNNYGVLQPMPRSKYNDKSPEIHLLKLSGNATQRGYAHGYLLYAQIIDWSVFFLFRTNMKGNLTYYQTMYTLWTEHQFVPLSLKLEVEAMHQGMLDAAKDSNTDLFVPDYNRLFTANDIYLMNAYLEVCIFILL